jgi:hypothetical protein
MSADHWDVCPRCLYKAIKADEAQRAAVEASYGRVPVEEFLAARAALPVEVDREQYRTFRENYEVGGADRGVVTVAYTGGCSKCRLRVAMNESKTFWEAKR